MRLWGNKKFCDIVLYFFIYIKSTQRLNGGLRIKCYEKSRKKNSLIAVTFYKGDQKFLQSGPKKVQIHIIYRRSQTFLWSFIWSYFISQCIIMRMKSNARCYWQCKLWYFNLPYERNVCQIYIYNLPTMTIWRQTVQKKENVTCLI